MDYIVDTRPDPAVAERLRDALVASDPAALVDTDARTGALRIATVLRVDELCAALDRVGLAVPGEAIALQPSNCCGGCGG